MRSTEPNDDECSCVELVTCTYAAQADQVAEQLAQHRELAELTATERTAVKFALRDADAAPVAAAAVLKLRSLLAEANDVWRDFLHSGAMPLGLAIPAATTMEHAHAAAKTIHGPAFALVVELASGKTRSDPSGARDAAFLLALERLGISSEKRRGHIWYALRWSEGRGIALASVDKEVRRIEKVYRARARAAEYPAVEPPQGISFYGPCTWAEADDDATLADVDAAFRRATGVPPERREQLEDVAVNRVMTPEPLRWRHPAAGGQQQTKSCPGNDDEG